LRDSLLNYKEKGSSLPLRDVPKKSKDVLYDYTSAEAGISVRIKTSEFYQKTILQMGDKNGNE
jgi:hypothetical protein